MNLFNHELSVFCYCCHHHRHLWDAVMTTVLKIETSNFVAGQFVKLLYRYTLQPIELKSDGRILVAIFVPLLVHHDEIIGN